MLNFSVSALVLCGFLILYKFHPNAQKSYINKCCVKKKSYLCSKI